MKKNILSFLGLKNPLYALNLITLSFFFNFFGVPMRLIWKITIFINKKKHEQWNSVLSALFGNRTKLNLKKNISESQIVLFHCNNFFIRIKKRLDVFRVNDNKFQVVDLIHGNTWEIQASVLPDQRVTMLEFSFSLRLTTTQKFQR